MMKVQTGEKVVFRFFDPKGEEGLWYTNDARFTDKIRKIVNKDMPMPINTVYRTNGKIWFSSADSIEALQYWFTIHEMKRLEKAGFMLGIFIVYEWIELEHNEIIFSECDKYKWHLPVSILLKKNKKRLRRKMSFFNTINNN